MTRKTTNLHSYALTHRTENNTEQQEPNGEEEELDTATSQIESEHLTTSIKTPKHNETITINLPKDCSKENIPNNTTIVIQSSNSNNINNISNDDGIHLFSSDTNEDFQVINAETTRIINGGREGEEEDENMNCVRNTDHDFYSKRSNLEVKRQVDDELQELQSNYFADASEESQGSVNMVVELMPTNQLTNNNTALEGNCQTFEIKTENITHNECLHLKQELQDPEYLNDMPSTSTQSNITQNMDNLPTSSKTKKRLSERDKYYRHKRRFNRRLEKRFDALLQVMGQIVKKEYPTVDVTPLVGSVTSPVSNMGKMLSSDSEDDDAADDDQSDDSNIPTTTQ